MGSKIASEPRKEEAIVESEKSCAHHWVIEPPNGPVSKGTCIKCGAIKEFDNWGRTEK